MKKKVQVIEAYTVEVEVPDDHVDEPGVLPYEEKALIGRDARGAAACVVTMTGQPGKFWPAEDDFPLPGVVMTWRRITDRELAEVGAKIRRNTRREAAKKAWATRRANKV